MVAKGRSKGRPTLTEVAEIDRAIRDAAAILLREQGQAATLQAVAQAAGLSRKSVYARYPNKEQLFLAVMREQLEAVNGIDYERSGTFEVRLLHYIEAALGVIDLPGARAVQRLLSVEPAYSAALRSEILSATHKIFLIPLIDLLREAKEANEAVLDEPEATARMLMPMIFAESFDWDETGNMLIKPMDRSAYAKRVAGIITLGLLPR
jgi:AcrR family transcriptional regulator